MLLNVYDTLLFRDRNLRLIPWLAESWRMVDPTTWVFKLRPNVKFHNGEDFDADAVKWSFDRLRDPNRRAVEGQSGHATYHSKEGAAALSSPNLAPTLEFEF